MSTNAEETNTNPMGEFFETLFERVLERTLEKRNALFPYVDPELADKLAKINAKQFITVPEAALLLGCSTSHLHKLKLKAEKGQAKNPIPYRDLDGVIVFPRVELIDWAMGQRVKLKAVS